MAVNKRHAYCTLLTNDEYLLGALVLAHSLRDNGTKVPLAVLVTKDVGAVAIDRLKGLYDQVIPVDRIVNETPTNIYLMDRPDLISTFTKIELWRQTQFDHLVYIDADVVALRAPDELFDLEAPFAAVTDIGWPDCFNSGVMSLKPNMADYYALLALAQRGISFDGADQGLLNMHFRAWHRLNFSYNCTPSGHYQYVPAYRYFQSTISLVHYIGRDKPWMGGNGPKGTSDIYKELLGRWWSVYDRHYRAPTPSYIPNQRVQHSAAGQQARSLSANDQSRSVDALAGERRNPEALAGSTQGPLNEQTESTAHIQLAEFTPVASIPQRHYFAEWDPMRQPPPANSRPEAINFPLQVYSMSADPQLFQPPKAYPEPPPNLGYQVPIAAAEPERLKPIFPWEARQTKAARVFPDDAPLWPQQTPSVTTDSDTQTETSMHSTPTLRPSSPQPFASYSRTNVWDEIPGILRYADNFLQKQRRRAEFHPRQPSWAESVPPEVPEDLSGRRRPSIILTDFPTEIERPSLPVTPAPIRRPSFWGEERNAAGELPRAEGVPEQSEWDPSARLEELQRKQSQVLTQGPTSPTRIIPNRSIIGSEPLAPIAQDPVPLASLNEFNFGEGGGAESKEIAPEGSPSSPRMP